jgi:pimeloyl-ACP methyl ester carboxylesterase
MAAPLTVSPSMRGGHNVGTFLVCHGAWTSGAMWHRNMVALMSSAGHELVAPTYTGLGERAHLASPEVDLDLHIRDIVEVIRYRDLRDIMLIGHSYGGMVATGVADQLRDRVSQLVYLDAWVPTDERSLLDLMPSARAQSIRSVVAETGDGWKIPPAMPASMGGDSVDAAWAATRLRPQPFRTFEQPIRLTGTDLPPRTYVRCTRVTPDDRFGPVAAMARADPSWRYREIDSNHAPALTAPVPLTRLLIDCLG